MYPDAGLNRIITDTARELDIKITDCRIHSSDVFYRESNVDGYKEIYKKHGCVCVEMESFALFHNAKVLGKRAACILTISDSFVSKKELSAKERETSFDEMMKTALESAIKMQG